MGLRASGQDMSGLKDQMAIGELDCAREQHAVMASFVARCIVRYACDWYT